MLISLHRMKHLVSYEAHTETKHGKHLHIATQVAQARYMSSSVLTFALLRNSSDLHIFKDLYANRSNYVTMQSST